MSDLMSDSELSVNKQVVGDVWPDHRHMSRIVTSCHDCHTPPYISAQFSGSQNWISGTSLRLLILCFIFLPSSLLFSGSNNCGVAVIRGEGIIPFWRNYVLGYNVTDLFSIEHSQPDQDTWAQTCLAKTLVRANPSNPEWSQEILWTLTSAESESASLDQKPT